MVTSNVRSASERHYSAQSAVSDHTGIFHFIAHFSGQRRITLRSHYIHWAMSCLLDIKDFHVPKQLRYVAIHHSMKNCIYLPLRGSKLQQFLVVPVEMDTNLQTILHQMKTITELLHLVYSSLHLVIHHSQMAHTSYR